MIDSHKGIYMLMPDKSPPPPSPQTYFFEINDNSKLSDRQRQLMEDLREEDDRLAGRGTSKGSKTAESQGGPDASGSSGSGSSGSGSGGATSADDSRSGISGFMRDAYDRVKSHLACKEEEKKKSRAASAK